MRTASKLGAVVALVAALAAHASSCAHATDAVPRTDTDIDGSPVVISPEDAPLSEDVAAGFAAAAKPLVAPQGLPAGQPPAGHAGDDSHQTGAASAPAAPAAAAAQPAAAEGGVDRSKAAAAADGQQPSAPQPAPGPPQPPAKRLFGAMKSSAQLAPRAIGFYSRGCLAGATPLAVDGPAWQAMRLSRNRNWGHPQLVKLIERFAVEAREFDGWNGLLVGDISQPRGGPMLTGHNSHQVGLDADIWFTPMPDRRLSPKEREELAATSMLADKITVDPKVWSPAHVQVVKRAASYKEVERVLVHPAIKKALCDAAGTDRAWLAKVRPVTGHFYHFHIRMSCPADSPVCRPQPPPGNEDGCGKELDDWFKLLTRPPAPPVPGAKPPPPRPELTLDQLPAECRTVLEVGIARPVDPEPVALPAPAAVPAPVSNDRGVLAPTAGAGVTKSAPSRKPSAPADAAAKSRRASNREAATIRETTGD